MGHFHTFLRKSIIKADFDPYFLVRFRNRNRGQITVFELFLRKSIMKADFDPFFLVQFPYTKSGYFEVLEEV